MSEFRRNPITAQWVILAANRGARPQEVVVEHITADHTNCPFCEGREKTTPGEVLALRPPGSAADGPGWQVRVVPNKFPALDAVQTERSVASHPSPVDDFFPGDGLHEVIVESPAHLTSVTQLNDPRFADVLGVYRQRLAALQASQDYRQVLLFKNAGPVAGATLSHVHSQLIATRIRANPFADRSVQFRQHAERCGNCLACQTIDEAIAESARLVVQTPHFVAFCPFAARFAYETWIMPRRHQPHFGEIESESLPELAALFREVLVKLERIVKLPAYNYIIHTAPFDTAAPDHYHWHIEILPRIANLAGFELGTGCFINTVPPDQAAAALREA
jgi:UDPglucose--hexose-1-phosphate uridylyltransferase